MNCIQKIKIVLISNIKLKIKIKIFRSKLVCSCPVKDHQSIVKLVIALTRHFYQLIGDRWNVIQNRPDGMLCFK